MTKLIAKEKFFYAGRNVEKDEEFEAVEQDVALLTGAVSPRAVRPAPHSEPPPAPEPAARPEMQSRSLLSEGDEDGDQQEVKSKRRYTRRDMRVED